MRNRKVAAALVLLLLCTAVSAAPLFNRSLSNTSNGINQLAGGYLPVSFQVNRSSRLQILPKGDEKATLSFSSSYSLSNTGEYMYYDKATGTPPNEWLNNGTTHSSPYIEYFNPTGSLSLSLSQKFDDWTYSVSISSRYSAPQEKLSVSSKTDESLTFSTYDSTNGKWTKKYTDKDAVYAYPWLYGDRTNLTTWMRIGASRDISTVKNLSYLNVSLAFEAGPWWLLNRVSNGGITLSDYCSFSASCSQSMLIKSEDQTISLRWLRISLSHSNSFSYTFGKIVPQNKLNSFRLRGYLTDSVSVGFYGPQILNSGTSVGVSVSYNHSLYFGGFENEKSGKSRGLAYSSNLSTSFSLSVFNLVSFSYSLTRYIAGGYTTSTGLRGSGEVNMSFNL